MAEAGGGRRVPVAQGTGSVAPFVGGGGWGHETVVPRAVALGGAGAGPRELWRRLGEGERCKWGLGAVEGRWRRGERERCGRKSRAGGGAGALSFVGAGPSVGQVGPLGSCRWRLGGRGGAGYWGAGSPPLSMDLPRRDAVPGEAGVAAAAANGTGPLGVAGVDPGGGGLGGAGLLWRGGGGRADTAPGRGGGPWW